MKPMSFPLRPAHRAAGVTLALVLLVSCATASHGRTSDILGIRLGMSHDAVRSALASSGTFQRQERKRQEIWSVRDPRFNSLILGFDEEGNVRFVTAVADPGGTPVRYGDLGDVAEATHREAGLNHTYTWEAGEHQLIAIGSADRVQYLSLKGQGGDKEEEEEEEREHRRH
jgi:hypothetical protein